MKIGSKSLIGEEDIQWFNGKDKTFTRKTSMGGKIHLTPVGKVVYPETWGAVGDGVTDDSEAIQNAINASHTHIVFSAKTYAIGTKLVISDEGNNFVGMGSGIGSTVFPTTLKWIGTADGMMIESGAAGDAIRMLSFENIKFDGNAKTAGVGISIDNNIDAASTIGVEFKRCVWDACKVGLELGKTGGVTDIRLDNCLFLGNTKHIKATHYNIYDALVLGTWFYGDEDTTHIIDNVAGKFHFLRCYFGVVATDGYVYKQTGEGVASFDSCYSESHGAYLVYASENNAQQGMTITNCWFPTTSPPTAHGAICFTADATYNVQLTIINTYSPQGLEIDTSGSAWATVINSTVGTISGTDYERVFEINNGLVFAYCGTPLGMSLGTSIPTYADNATAISAGLTAGRLYRTAVGILMICYTP